MAVYKGENKRKNEDIRYTFISRGEGQMAETPKFSTAEEYIAAKPAEIQDRLHKMREAIRRAAPEAEERMSWRMPTFYLHENLVHFAAEKRHVGFHPTPSAILAFADRLKPYKTSKGTVRFPYNEPIPYDLVEEMTRFRVKEVRDKRK